jgi:hypothetical protein
LVGEDIAAVGAALARYAATVAAIKAQLESLRSQAQGFVDENGDSDDWEDDDGKGDHTRRPCWRTSILPILPSSTLPRLCSSGVAWPARCCPRPR